MTTWKNIAQDNAHCCVSTNSHRMNFAFISNLKVHFITVLLVYLCGSIVSPAMCSEDVNVINDVRGNSVLTFQLINGKKVSSIIQNVLPLSLKNSDLVKNFGNTLDLIAKGRMKRSLKVTRNVSHNPNMEGQYYLDALFLRYGNETFLSLNDFDKLLLKIGLTKMTHNGKMEEHDHNHHGHNLNEEHGHDDHHDHGHEHDENEEHSHNDHNHDHHDHNHDHHDHNHDHQHHDIEKRHTIDNHSHAGDEDHNHTEQNKCLTSEQLLHNYGLEGKTELGLQDFMSLCPALVYHLDAGFCKLDAHSDSSKDGEIEAIIWLYTMLAVFVISLLALFCIACIPQQDKTHYDLVSQFMIAIAMSTMSADGLLHLIPHSMTPDSHSDDDGHGDHGGHLEALYKGLVILFGIYIFFILERGFALYRGRKNAKRQNRRSGMQQPMMKDASNNRSGMMQMDMDAAAHQGIFSCTSLAMMIIVGDMIHNFCDGLAIGAAFSGSLSVGLSTSIAVFCHELPHEIGDFAILIRSGMGRCRAIAFNLLSTVPCFAGAAIGLKLGNLGEASSYIFALVGGMFLYISLVDLIPEMTKAYESTNGPWHKYMILHGVGIVIGVVIMLVLGIYEEELQRILT